MSTPVAPPGSESQPANCGANSLSSVSGLSWMSSVPGTLDCPNTLYLIIAGVREPRPSGSSASQETRKSGATVASRSLLAWGEVTLSVGRTVVAVNEIQAAADAAPWSSTAFTTTAWKRWA
jgi:hypothetical protein